MKTLKRMKREIHGVLLTAGIFASSMVQAAPTTAYQAEELVQNWLAMDNHPLEAAMSPDVNEVTTYKDADGSPLYHVVYLLPKGFVVVSGDDMVEPIIAFVPDGIRYLNSEDNPLGALLKNDVPHRIKYVQTLEMKNLEGATGNKPANILAAQKKWESLSGNRATKDLEAAPPSSISDVRVAPLLQTKWEQAQEASGKKCYNLYTPNNYYCGCVATTMSQIMRFFEFPSTSIPQSSYEIKVSNDGGETYQTQNRAMLGGVYEWEKMPNGPTIPNPEQRQAIGRLTHDTGCTLNTRYSLHSSFSNTLKISERLKEPFGYSNAVKGYNSGSNIETTQRNTMINPNLDAGRPVGLGIKGFFGHSVVADGYGYDNETLYHHLNMGWVEEQGTWYNLPDIRGKNRFNSVHKIIYNIYTNGTGEIISGRITDRNGSPIAGVTVSAGGKSDLSNAHGIYAIEKLPSARTYTVNAVKTGHYFSPVDVTVGTSVDNETVGNVWGVNFVEDTSEGDSYEPDNTPQTAKNIVANTSQTHSVVPTGDQDWVKFTLPSQSSISLETSGSRGGDTKLWLYNNSFDEIAVNDDGGTDRYSLITKGNLPVGTYYAKVEEFGNDHEIPSYTLTLTVSNNGISPMVSQPEPMNRATLIQKGPAQVLRVAVTDASSGIFYYGDNRDNLRPAMGTIHNGWLETSIPYADNTISNHGTTYWYAEAMNSSGTTRYPANGTLVFRVFATPPFFVPDIIEWQP